MSGKLFRKHSEITLLKIWFPIPPSLPSKSKKEKVSPRRLKNKEIHLNSQTRCPVLMDKPKGTFHSNDFSSFKREELWSLQELISLTNVTDGEVVLRYTIINMQT